MPDFHLKPLGEKLIQQPSAIGTVASKSAFLAPACGSKAFVEGSLLLSQRGLFFAAPHDDIFWEKKHMAKNHAITMKTHEEKFQVTRKATPSWQCQCPASSHPLQLPPR